MTIIVDASVVLAVILGERGGIDVAQAMNGATVSVVNLSEVYRRLIDAEVEAVDAVTKVGRLQMEIAPFDEGQAIAAAELRPSTRHIGASFADRACLALALTRGLPVYTADRRWSELDLPIDIRQIRT